MQVEVHYHAFLREKLRRKSELLVVSGEGSNASDVISAFIAAHPEMERLASALNIAINDEIAGRDALVHESDRIDLLPPYGGG